MSKSNINILLILALLGLSSSLSASEGVSLSSLFGSTPKFLPVSQAFNVSATQEGDKVAVQFVITPEHYVYRDKITLSLPDGKTIKNWQFNATPTTVDDPAFGKMSVFMHDVGATLMLSDAQKQSGTAKITWQGCAVAGLCYPPETVNVNLQFDVIEPAKADTKPVGDQDDRLTNDKSPNTAKVQAVVNKIIDDKANTQTLDNEAIGADNLNDKALDNEVLSADDTAGEVLSHHPNQTPMPIHMQLSHTQQASHSGFGIESNPILAVFLLFLAGVTLAFSACVYPMIPIVANIVARSHNPTAMRAFALTSAYGLGVATSYGILGAIIAWFGRSIGIIGYLQNPWVLTTFAVMFVLLALQMFGVLNIGLPSTLKNRLAQNSQRADKYLGSLGGSFLVGALSSLVVSPCVSAPLAGALIGVATVGSVALGFVALFALGLGLSLPLIFVGTAQGKFMPKTGSWMEGIKFFGAIMLLMVAILLLNRVFLSPIMLVIWAGWFVLVGLFLWKSRQLFLQILASLAMMWAICLMMGAAMGASDVMKPLQAFKTDAISNQSNDAITITKLEQLDALLSTHNKVLVDVTADWCIECRIMENTLFANAPKALADWQVVKLDISQTTEDSRAVLARYNLFGPPALIYYKDGQLQAVQLGEVARADFEAALINY